MPRFLEGRPITDIERAWDQMYFSTQYYGRRGIVVNAISAVDLAPRKLITSGAVDIEGAGDGDGPA